MDVPTFQLRRIGGTVHAFAAIGAALRLCQAKQRTDPAVEARLLAVAEAVLPGALDVFAHCLAIVPTRLSHSLHPELTSRHTHRSARQTLEDAGVEFLGNGPGCGGGGHILY